jgi:methylornithine synthase
MVLNYLQEKIINKAWEGRILEKDEIVELLSIEGEDGLEALFEKAKKIKEKIFSNKVFLYGFLYFSTWCRNNCNFCYFRKSNDIERYRKTSAEVLDIAERLADSGVHLIDLTMGEDIKYHAENFQSFLDTVRKIKKSTGLPVMISAGVLNNKVIDEFAKLGSEWYALYQETHNRELFKNLRILQDYDERMNAKLYAQKKGMLIEEGILTGVGETLEDIAESILMMGKINANQVRVMSFIPQEGTPMENMKTQDRDMELKIIAILRLMYPYALIPASLDVDGISGLKNRINAGANVVTSIIPPKEGLMGVAQSTKDVDDGGRTVDGVRAVLSEMGIEPATTQDYREYIRTNFNIRRCS